MIFGFTILLVALLLSGVAAYYSVAGLVAVFSAATVPVIIMGGSLELGKIAATVWLHNNWRRAGWAFKFYLIPAVTFLMLLTSMGIFGYLSKAHSDQSLVSGDALAKLAIYDEKIRTERENIESNRRTLKQLDEAVDQLVGRSRDERGIERSVVIRRNQQAERTRIGREIDASQKRIATLNEERAPLAAAVRQVEAEVGPIKYIAALVYDENPDENTLERAVRLMIIMIVLVFDPLALTLILAANKQFQWAREGKGGWRHNDAKVAVPPAVAQVATPQPVIPDPLPMQPETRINAEPLPEPVVVPPEMTDDEIEQFYKHTVASEKNAMRRWKAENQHDTIKHQRRLFNAGKINKLPWQDNIERTETFGDIFPDDPLRGDLHISTTKFPNPVYKFNGADWIEIDKNQADSYAYNADYISYLIKKLSSGEYDAELLSDREREQIAQCLKQNG